MIFELYRRYYGKYFRAHSSLHEAISSMRGDWLTGEAFGVGIIDTEKKRYYVLPFSDYSMLEEEVAYHAANLDGYLGNIEEYDGDTIKLEDEEL